MPRVTAEYPYEREIGEVRYLQGRLHRTDGKKGFQLSRPDGNGGRIYNMDGVERIPYRLPQLREAVAARAWVVIVEGEKDVHSLVDLGRIATTFVGGAGKFLGHNYEQWFTGALVILIPDMDAPGCKHAIQIAKALEGIAKRIKIYIPAEGCKDVTEHLEAGYALSDLIPFSVAGLAERFGVPLDEPKRRRVLHDVTHMAEVESPEMVALRAELGELQDQLSGAEREIRAWRARCAELTRDRDADAAKDQMWPLALALFREWREVTNHRRSEFTTDRFMLLAPYLKRHGEMMVRCAIHGIGLDPFTTPRANGTVERHDSWETMLKSQGSFERYCNRAPIEMLKEAQAPKRREKREDPPAQLQVLPQTG